jgi:chromosomal replication initiation ATPase DnaA
MKKEIFNKYVDSICKLFDIDKEELFSKKRTGILVDARQLLYYMCIDRRMQITTIQKLMRDNGYDTNHSTIITGIRSMRVKIQDDPDYRVVIYKLKDNAEISI